MRFNGSLFGVYALIIVINLSGYFSIAQDDLINLENLDRLIRAVKRSHAGVVRFFIRGRVNLNDLEKFTITPLMWAARRGDIDMAGLLIEEGKAEVNLLNSEKSTALTYAILSNDIDVVKYFVEVLGANLHYLEQTVLIHAVVLGNVNMDIIEYLSFKLGDYVNARDRYGATALMHAALYGDIDMVRFLVEEAGANIYLQDNIGASAVTICSRWGLCKCC